MCDLHIFHVTCAHNVFVGPGFEPLTVQGDILLVPGLIHEAGRLFQASKIRGLCHTDQERVHQCHVSNPIYQAAGSGESKSIVMESWIQLPKLV